MPTNTATRKSSRRRTSTTTSFSPSAGISSSFSTVDYDAPQTVQSRDRSWVHTPNYRMLVKTHQSLPDNPFSLTEWSIPSSGGTVEMPSTQYDTGDWSQTQHIYTGPAGVGVSIPPFISDFSELNARLISRAKGNQWNVPIFIAEGRKTANMVANAAVRVVSMARALKRGRLGDFLKMSHPDNKVRVPSKGLDQRFRNDYGRDPKRAAANYWLEMTYGWTPFLSEVRNAVNTLMDVAERPDSLDSTVKASLSRFTTSKSSEDQQIFSNSLGFSIRGYYEYMNKTSFRGKWRFTMNPLSIPGRFGLLNPLEVAWELVPLSFVADWFIPIGGYLSQLDTPLRFNHRGGTYGVRQQTLMSTVPTHMTPSNGTFTGFGGSGDYTTLRRVAMTGIPSVTLSSVRFDPKIGAARATSAIALLTQFFVAKR